MYVCTYVAILPQASCHSFVLRAKVGLRPLAGQFAFPVRLLVCVVSDLFKPLPVDGNGADDLASCRPLFLSVEQRHWLACSQRMQLSVLVVGLDASSPFLARSSSTSWPLWLWRLVRSTTPSSPWWMQLMDGRGFRSSSRQLLRLHSKVGFDRL